MAKDSQTPQESSNKERSKSTPLQGTDYARKSSWVDPKPKYNNLEEWQKDVSTGHPSVEKPNVIAFAHIRYPFAMMLMKGLFVFKEFPTRGP